MFYTNGLNKINMRIFSFILLFSISFTIYGQLNWKNKKPFSDYWQQEVKYSIQAKVDERKLTISGDLELIYTNNSPDNLKEVYFHLYQNAFQEGAYYDLLQKTNGRKPRYGLYEENGLGTRVNELTSSNGIDTVIHDNTIMKVVLKKPIRSNESIVFNIKFQTYWGSGSTRRRMKAYYVEGRNVHFNGVHWYPRIAVYDQKFGWNTNQHLDKEFYGDFGTFDVELNFANDYVVEATGTLVNQEEVLPSDLKQQLHISNFYHRGKKGKGDTLSIPTKRLKDERKTWKYHAENVHDFAFTADPTYRIDEREWNGIKTVAIVEERHCPNWKTAAEFAMDVIKVYSKDFGMYEYPKMVVADARDGMEYPMLTLDAGRDPYYKGLLAHEIAHNWFYGMVGSNETYRAFMDEGFTQFLTVWSLEKIDGEIYSPYNQKGKSWYKNKFKSGPKSRDMRAYFGYMNEAIKLEDPSLNTHSSDFDGGSIRHGGGYRQVYSKTAVMLYNLQYVLGDSLFLASMKNYVNEWKFKHPYPEDFRKSIIRYTKVDLNWFFDQWLETSKIIDYKIKGIKKIAKDSFEITFKRIGEMQMPIDFEVVSNADSVINYHIPNTWFVKKTESIILPKWYGWGKFNPEYTTKVYVPEGIFNIQIDPSGRLADINPLNNSQKLPYSIEFDAQLRSFPDRQKYVIKLKPDLLWNSYDGLKIGLTWKSDFFKIRKKIDAKFWMNSTFFQSDYGENVWINRNDDFLYDLKYEDILPNYAEKFKVKIRIALTGGVHKFQTGLHKTSHNHKLKFGVYAKSLFRSNSNQLNYALYPDYWNIGALNNSINSYFKRPYTFIKGKGVMNIKFRASAILSDYNYEYIKFENLYQRGLKKFHLKTRIFGFLGFGNNWAPESMLFLAGANPEKINENKFTRAEGVFTKNQTQFGDNINTFHSGGGLNLRGYAGYVAPELVDGNIVSALNGTRGASASVELEFDRYLGLNQLGKLSRWIALKSYAFCDAGLINLVESNVEKFAEPRLDAGLGGTISFKKFYQFETTKPVTLRVDFPLLLNRTPNVNPEYYSFKWIIGMNRAF
ncbi:MAG: aminopeptidase [Flavobacteriales bacterium]|nr:aminopeptidase [Flavobacteriales bacterium]